MIVDYPNVVGLSIDYAEPNIIVKFFVWDSVALAFWFARPVPVLE